MPLKVDDSVSVNDIDLSQYIPRDVDETGITVASLERFSTYTAEKDGECANAVTLRTRELPEGLDQADHPRSPRAPTGNGSVWCDWWWKPSGERRLRKWVRGPKRKGTRLRLGLGGTDLLRRRLWWSVVALGPGWGDIIG